MGLEINQSFGRVGINSTDALISMKSQRAEVRVKSRPPRGQIDIQQAKIIIDQKQCFNEVGLKTPDTHTRDIAAKSRQEGQRAVASIARKGDFLSRVDKNPNAIPALARNAMPDKTDYNIVAMPKSRPIINFTGNMDISWQMGSVEINTTEQRLQMSATRGSVEVYMLQKAHIEVAYRRESFNTTI